MRSQDQKTFLWGLSLVRPYLAPFFLFTLVQMAIKYLDTLEPMYSGYIIDALAAGERGLFFRQLATLFFLLLANLLIALALNWVRTRHVNRITRNIELEYVDRLVSSRHFQASAEERAKIKNVILSDLSKLISFYTSSIPDFIVVLFSIAIIAYRLVVVSWKLFVLASLLSAVPILINIAFAKPLRDVSNRSRMFQDDYLGEVNSYVDGQKTISQNGNVPFFIRHYGSVLDRGFSLVENSVGISNRLSVLMHLANTGANAITYILLAYLVLDGGLSIGSMVSMTMLAGQLRSILTNLSSHYQNAAVALVSISRVHSTWTYDADVPCWSQQESGSVPSVQISSFSFAYDTASLPVFSSFSYTFTGPGLYILKGQNGTGKTTLLNSIAGLFPADAVVHGRIAVSGEKPVFLFQDEAFFSMDLNDNISLGRPAAAESAKYNSDRLLHSIDDIPVDALSSGQKRRLAIARLLWSPGGILLLDEADANLDAEALAFLHDTIAALASDKLVIAASHGSGLEDIPHTTVLL